MTRSGLGHWGSQPAKEETLPVILARHGIRVGWYLPRSVHTPSGAGDPLGTFEVYNPERHYDILSVHIQWLITPYERNRGMYPVVREWSSDILRPHVQRVLSEVDLRSTRLLFVDTSPTPPKKGMRRVLLVGGGFQSGILTSASTHWPGIVTNVDIAPTILRILDIPLSEAREAGMIGMPIETTVVPPMGGDNPLAYIQRLDRWTASMHPSLSRIYTLFGIIEGLLVLTTIGACAVTRQRIRNVHLAGRALLTTTLLLPLAMIPVGLWKFTSSGVGGESELYLSLALAAACALTTLFLRQAISLWVTVGTLTLAADLVLHFSRFSPFAFSLVSGSRFYGMGNEHMALLVACLVLWVGMNSDRSTRTDRLSKGVLCAVVAVMLGNSSFGANFGGALTAAAALGTAWVAMSSPRWTWRQTLLVVLLVAVVAGVTALDFTRAASAQSHIGRTFGMSLQRVDPLLDTMKQKLAMNWKFMLATPVSLLEIVLMVFLAKCIYRPYPSIQKLFDSRPRLHRTLYGAPVGMLVGFLAYVSGIVVLVLMLVVYVPAILGLLIE
ncbi:MAG: hypothetical protein HY318_17340, partial [Armatimonadetes bacterium]|nr:hypothetical protein [Armatimonadota bacterium]